MQRQRLGLPAFGWVFFLLVFVVNFAAAQALPSGVTKGPSVEGITEYRLPNGLKVLLFPDPSKPTVTVNITYLVGSRFENYGETGMAHLLEHMMFKGTPTHPHITQDFNRRGMRFNGTTDIDRTNYYEMFEANDDNLRWALKMEADRMVHSNIARKDLDSEMTVVRNEFEMGENSPFSVLIKRMQGAAYDWHNYGNPTIGNRSDIENVGIENLQAFYRLYYQPDNAVLLVAGKFDAAKTLRWITDDFGAIAKPKRKRPVFWTVEPTQDGDRSFTVRRKGDSQIVLVAYHMPSGLHEDSDALDFAGEILADTPNGRLHKLLVETGKAAQVFNSSLAGHDPGLYYLGAEIKAGEPVEPVRDALIAAVEDFHNHPPTKEEMERVRRNFDNQLDKMLNDHERIGIALSESIALGDWRLQFHARDVIAGMTPERVAAAADHYFKRDNRTVGLFLPEDHPQRADVPGAPSAEQVLKNFKPRAETSTAEAFDPSQANIDKRTHISQVGGMQLALLPKKNRGETVSVSLRLHWGDEKSLFGKKLASSMTQSMLTRGNAKFTREQLADEFTRLKITGNLFHFDTTREHLADALRLVGQVLKEPTFPPAEFEQLRKQSIVAAEAARNQPATLASQAVDQHFNRYPKGDWRSPMTTDEEIAQLQKITLDEVKAFHRDFYGASKAELSVVGDFDEAAIRQVAADVFGNWKSALPYTRVAESYFDIPAGRFDLNAADKENGFYMARLSLELRDDDPDYPALIVANFLFGDGGLNSRLMDRIRQKEGLSYGGRSGLDVDSLDRVSTFSIAAIAAPQNLARVDVAVKDELARALKEGFTADELARAKSGLLQERLQNRAQDSVLSNVWVDYLYLGRTFKWSKDVENRINALTVDQVNAAFRKWIDPSRLTVAIAGDAAKIKAAAKP